MAYVRSIKAACWGLFSFCLLCGSRSEIWLLAEETSPSVWQSHARKVRKKMQFLQVECTKKAAQSTAFLLCCFPFLFPLALLTRVYRLHVAPDFFFSREGNTKIANHPLWGLWDTSKCAKVNLRGHQPTSISDSGRGDGPGLSGIHGVHLVAGVDRMRWGCRFV